MKKNEMTNNRNKNSGLVTAVFSDNVTTLVVTKDRVVKIDSGLVNQTPVTNYDEGLKKIFDYIQARSNDLTPKDSAPSRYNCRLEIIKQ